MKRFSLKITNGAAAAKTVAILTGTWDTLGLTEGTPNTKHNHDKALIAARYPQIDAVADDATGIATSVDCEAIDSNFKVSAFRNWLAKQTNPVKLVSLDIQASNASAYNETITFIPDDPMDDSGKKNIYLNQFYSQNQFQDGKITVPFVNADYPNGLPINQNIIMLAKVPAGVNVTYNFNFK